MAWLLGIFIISILLNIFEISGGESIYEKVMLLVIEIWGITDAIIIMALICILVILLVIEYCAIFRDIVPEFIGRKKEAQKILLIDLYYIKAEISS